MPGGLAAAALLFSVRAVPADLENGGFEADPPTRGWSIHVYGAEPQISADLATQKEGKRSLRISAREPSDAALGQNLYLLAGRLHRLRGWVRTEGLERQKGARVGGAMMIQRHDGRFGFAGRSRAGTADWQEESILFRAPDDGQVRVALFLAGFGKGTGTVWFDGLRIEEAEESEDSSLRVTSHPIHPTPLSPFLNGQFVEFLCDLVPAMHAERLDDDSFEGLPPYKVQYLGAADDRRRPWHPSGDKDLGEYSLDRENPFNGAVSERIRAAAGKPGRPGISQEGIFFAEGQALKLRLYLKGEAPDGGALEAGARLEVGGRVLAAASLGRVSDRWQLHEARLSPSAGSRSATLSVDFQGPGTLWIDRVSLLPEDAAPGGWRPDVVVALRDLRPGIIRLGGTSTEAYEWEGGVGDPDRRVPFTTVWGGLESNRVGLDEFLTLCRLVDAEPLICVRWTGESPQDAANQVEYLNGAAESPFGRKRAANGHPEPYRVKYWQIGNEVGGAKYEETIAAFARAMKGADPGIRLLSSFPSEKILANAAPLLDYLCPHHYGCADLPGMEEDLRSLRAMLARWDGGRNLEGGRRNLRVAVTEWNTTAGDWGPGRAALLSLDNALKCARYLNLLQRQADLVEIAIRSNLTNSFCSGIIQTRGPGLYLAPTFHAQQLYARSAGDRALRVETALDPARDLLDVSATLAPGDRLLRLYAVNDSKLSFERRIDLRALGGAKTPIASAWWRGRSRWPGRSSERPSRPSASPAWRSRSEGSLGWHRDAPAYGCGGLSASPC